MLLTTAENAGFSFLSWLLCNLALSKNRKPQIRDANSPLRNDLEVHETRNIISCIQDLKPTLNVQSDSLRANVFNLALFYANSLST